MNKKSGMREDRRSDQRILTSSKNNPCCTPAAVLGKFDELFSCKTRREVGFELFAVYENVAKEHSRGSLLRTIRHRLGGLIKAWAW